MIESMKISESRSKGGRPAKGTAKERMERLLNEATRVFLEYGYGLSSIDILAREAHVAKRTIYQHFGNKAELFGAVVHRLSDSVLAPFPNLSEDTRPIEQVLVAFAQQLITRVTSQEAIGLQRIVIGEASRFPELAKLYYDNGPARAIFALANYLQHQNELGVLELIDANIAAEQFLNMVLGELHRRVLLGVEPVPNSEQVKCRINSAVNLFLRGYGYGCNNTKE
ncbi:TetR family transcriptional regulator [Chlorogloeopsis fritschii PCC 6912]|uniref:TetR family transcriptional regulator n=2 Tax=Chlorogloeopsis fritschii TaxID=1124 RepID=A0A3S1FMG0_CHLFR|nr:TetR family transcriptional regulator [Chlorogloeopsis fritschii PCC 6912]